jgi:hypothetical protein
MYVELAVLALFIFCYSLVAGRLERAATSGPIVFVVAGLLMGPLGAWLVRWRCLAHRITCACRSDPCLDSFY